VIVSCPSCKARYQYDEARFGESYSRKLKCTKCATVFDVTRPGADEPEPEPAPPVPGAAKVVPDTTRQLDLQKLAASRSDSELPELAPLSPRRRYSLAVILGANAGQIHQVAKPRVVLGRGAECDLQLQDSEVSRRHAMLEIHGDEALVSDLGSTNGTYVDGVRIKSATIAGNQEFSLGTTTLMFIVTDVHDSAAG